MKHIKSRIIVVILALVLAISLPMGFMSMSMSQKSALGSLEKSMIELARVASERVSREIVSYENIAREVGSMPELSNPAITLSQKQEILDQRAQAYGFTRGNITDATGRSIFDGLDLSDRAYFKEAMQGRAAVSDPLVSRVTGEISVIISAPLWQDGVPDSTPVGMVYFVPKETFLSDIVSSIAVGDTGSAYMINNEGTVIAHRDASLVMQDNSIEDAKTDKALEPVAKMESAVLAGESGFGKYQWDGKAKIMAYAPVPASNGWGLAVTAEQKEFMGAARTATVVSILSVILFIVIGVLVAIRFGSAISGPVSACAKRIMLLSQGDLRTPVPAVSTADETKGLADATGIIVEGLHAIIEDMIHLLEQMAQGNFDIHTAQEDKYIGDFAPLLNAMRGINRRLSSTLWQINEAADQVSAGSDQVSAGAQALSQGATEQASAVEEIAATFSEVTSQIRQTAALAGQVRGLNQNEQEELDSCDRQMEQMMDAILLIHDKSGEIGKIIKTIEDISFQTNILALNAAVEAARAGTAGKGFAVVADEVRNLANKSSQAAKDTTSLIESTIASVEEGTALARQTAESMQRAVEGAKEVFALTEKISKAASEQANAAAQINQGMEQVSSVVQTNSATAEQSAASSEELSGQSQMLKDLVSQFRLRKEDVASSHAARSDMPFGEQIGWQQDGMNAPDA